MSAARNLRRDDLFDLLVAMPEGVTVSEIATALSCDRHHARVAIHDLRLLLGATDDINLPATPQSTGQEWRYHLTGNLDGCREWVANRVVDATSRITTMQAVMSSAVKASDGRTLDGRRARAIERALRHLVEDLDAMSVDD